MDIKYSEIRTTYYVLHCLTVCRTRVTVALTVHELNSIYFLKGFESPKTGSGI